MSIPTWSDAPRSSFSPARSGCWRWKGRSGQPSMAPNGRHPTEQGRPSAQNAGTPRAPCCARERGNGHVAGVPRGCAVAGGPATRASPATAANEPLRSAADLLELDGGPRLLELALELVGFLLLGALLDGLGRLVDERLGLLQAQPRRRADDLDHLDLLVPGLGQDHVERDLLLGRLG